MEFHPRIEYLVLALLGPLGMWLNCVLVHPALEWTKLKINIQYPLVLKTIAWPPLQLRISLCPC